MYDRLKTNIRMIDYAFRGHVNDRRRAAYDIQVSRGIADVLETIDRRWPGAAGRSDEAPVFLFSSGWRAGSTLMQRMLMSDPSLMIWGEPYHNSGIFDGMINQLRAMTHQWPKDHFFISKIVKNGAKTGQESPPDFSGGWIANLWPDMTSLVDSHYAFHNRLFAEPARAYGRPLWGIKEVRSSTSHARYLKWLYPKARFIFLYRNPYDAYASYRQYIGMSYWRWPEAPVLTARHFGNMWRELTTGFLAEAGELDAFPVQYEKLKDSRTHEDLCHYLGLNLTPATQMSRVRGVNDTKEYSQGTRYLPRLEQYLLRKAVDPLAHRLGYDGLSRLQP